MSDKKKKTPFHKILERSISNASSMLEDCVDTASRGRGDSPIESLLFAALFMEIKTGSHEHDSIYAPNRGERFDYKKQSHAPYSVLVVESQVNVEGVRVDFLITTQNGCANKWKQLVVECDGHEFHERTKEQAARDRSRDRLLQEAGFTVFRFTGSEIWRDPCGCADQIIEWASNALCPL